MSEQEFVEVLVKLPREPEGYEYTGDFNILNAGELYLSKNGSVLEATTETLNPRHKLRKIKWVPKEWESFYFVTPIFCVASASFDSRDSFHRKLFEIGNFFKSKEEALAIGFIAKEAFKAAVEDFKND